MKSSSLEPGLLRILRMYAVLRLGFFALLPLASYRSSFRNELGQAAELTFVILFTSAEIIYLFVYLFWPRLPEKLGRLFLPILLCASTAWLILEDHLFLPLGSIWQSFIFLFILLIITAWQYSFRQVAIFALVTGGLEVILIQFFPMPVLPESRFEWQNYFAYGMLIARTASFLILGYVMTSLVAAQRRQRLALAEANQKLVRHAATLEQLAISRERVRLSRELHDTLAHTLSALSVQIDALNTVWDPMPDKARQMLDGMLETTRSGLDETRRSLGALRAAPLEEMGLGLALQTLVGDFAARNALSLEIDIPENLDDISPEVEQCFYRIAQEALMNIDRHAEAQTISLRLDNNSSRLTMAISDDGRGFYPDVGSEREQLGLQGMRERAELIGAHFVVESGLGKGTTVRLRWEATT